MEENVTAVSAPSLLPGFRAISLARSDEQLIAHQRAMGVTKTILLPAGREVLSASTHQGRSNGLEGTCTSNEACMALAQRFPNEFAFGANEVSDLQEAPSTIETYLKRGAVLIGEQKFGVECDSPEMQKLYQLAAAYGVPILMHWQVGSYNYGFERFHRMLEKYPKVNFKVSKGQLHWSCADVVGQHRQSLCRRREEPLSARPRHARRPHGSLLEGLS